MKIFTVCGISKSGKTTTIERIITEIKRRGYSVGSIKDIHFEGFTMDTEGTNTHRHKMAGAEIVTARGLNETAVLFPERLSLDKIIPFYHQDFLVMEGVDEPGIPMILTAHSDKELIEKYTPDVFAVSGKITADISEFRGLPAIDATTDVEALVDLIWEAV